MSHIVVLDNGDMELARQKHDREHGQTVRVSQRPPSRSRVNRAPISGRVSMMANIPESRPTSEGGKEPDRQEGH